MQAPTVSARARRRPQLEDRVPATPHAQRAMTSRRLRSPRPAPRRSTRLSATSPIRRRHPKTDTSRSTNQLTPARPGKQQQPFAERHPNRTRRRSATSDHRLRGHRRHLMKTTNAGETWQPIAKGLPIGDPHGNCHCVLRGGIRALAVDPRRSGTVYAALTQGGIYKTTNGGHTWTRASARCCYDAAVAVDPARPATIYAAGPSETGTGPRFSEAPTAATPGPPHRNHHPASIFAT